MVFKASIIGAVFLVLAAAALLPARAHAQGDPVCPGSWPGANPGLGGIGYQDFYTDINGRRWFIIRSQDSNDYTTIRAYPANDRYRIGYVPGEACTFVVRHPSDAEPHQWEFIDGLTGVDGDRQALASLYQTTGGDQWLNNDGWLTDRPMSDWYGVTTDADGRVTELRLITNGLTGTITPRIAALTHLTRLELWDHQLGGAIPAQLGDLSRLEYVDLDHNQLTGEIPAALGNLSRLTYLGLDWNQLTGEIPPALAKLSSLEALELHGNQLTGEIPAWLGELPNLGVLALADNKLTGGIPPELGNLNNATIMLLDTNQLTGSIPPELGNMTNIGWLTLHENRLTGTIPPGVGRFA